MQKIPENIITVVKAFLPLFTIIILFVIVGNFGFGQIGQIRDKVISAESDQKTLTQKMEVLRNVSAQGAQISNFAVAALPDSNSSLAVMSQLRTLAQNQNLFIANIKSSDPTTDPTGLSSVGISFNLSGGSRAQLESFANSLGSIAPITLVVKIKLSEDSPGSALANVSVKSFWAAFPTKIPALTEAISDLTPDEQQLLQKISALTQPVFVQLPPAGGGGRSDPFSL
jgi:hypothetical protein